MSHSTGGQHAGTEGPKAPWVSPVSRGHGTGTASMEQERCHAGISPCLIPPGSLWELMDHLPGSSHHSSWQNSPAGSTTHQKRQENQLEKLQSKENGVIRALENVTCDERWKRLGPVKPGEGKGEDVITVLKYVEGNCKRKGIKHFLNNLGKL